MAKYFRNQDSEPLVSIIIPLYNSGKFIASSIESALHQTWQNKEVIVMDDGSSDNSYAIAKSLESDSIKVYTQKNQGSCAARNNGFTLSKGTFIQYLDADDLMSQDKIEKQIGLLLNTPAAQIASCAWGRFETNPEDTLFIHEPVWKDMLPVDWLTTAWLGGGMMQTACWLTPRSLIEQAGPWNESFKKNPTDDSEFFCRVLLKSQGVKYCENAKVYYRSHHGERVSMLNSKVSVQSLLSTYISYEENIRIHELSPRVVQALTFNYASFIYKYYNLFPDLSAIAEERINLLGEKKIPLTGGKYFKRAAALIGFKPMLKLRSLFKKY